MATPDAGSNLYKLSGTLQFDHDAALKFIGVRAFVMSASTIADVMDDFYLVLGEKFVDARLYLGGKRAGKRTAAALANANKIDVADKPALEKFYADFYAALGWAKLDFQLDYAQHAGAVIAHNSFLAQGALAKFTARGAATRIEDAKLMPRCAMLAGYIAGLVSFLFDVEMDARESACIAQNHSACRFEISRRL
ncbi:MAG: hypothetical protein HZC40_09845 [Chloroflexi bacterium]|nr:hypothetical protein [Chloroflexota bacterium]